MSLPEADISTVRSLLFLLFLEMQTHTLTFSYSIHISFLRSLPMFFPVCTLAQCFRLVLSGIQSKEINLVSLYLCVLFFFVISLSTRVLSHSPSLLHLAT